VRTRYETHFYRKLHRLKLSRVRNVEIDEMKTGSLNSLADACSYQANKRGVGMTESRRCVIKRDVSRDEEAESSTDTLHD
jgi:hypothetical protein